MTNVPAEHPNTLPLATQEQPALTLLERRLGFVQMTIAWVITVFAAVLVGIFATHAGGLWRDEVNSIEITAHTSLKTLWGNLSEDSFPIFWFLLLRVGQVVGLLSSDVSYRIMGAVVGACVIPAVWFVFRQLKVGPPILSIALIYFNPMVLRTICANRAYGFSVILVLLTIGAVWRMCDTPSRRSLALALLAALAATHTVFYNIVFVAGICAGGLIAANIRKSRLAAIYCCAIVAVCMISLLPYYGIIHHQRVWAPMLAYHVQPSDFLNRMGTSLAGEIRIHPLPIGMYFGWQLTFCLVLAAIALLPNRYRANRAVILYLAGVGLLTTIVTMGFFCVMGRPIVFWYLAETLVTVSVCTDAIVGAALRRPAEADSGARRPLVIGGVRGILAVAIAGCAAPAIVHAATVRQTNADLVARDMRRLMAPGDLFVVWPSGFGVVFSHYDNTKNGLESLPPIRVHRFGGPDFIMETMRLPQPCGELSEKMNRTLAGGHTVWIAGTSLPPPGAPAFGGSLPNDVRHGTTWAINDYLGGQVSRYIDEHAEHVEVLHPTDGRSIWSFEDITVTKVSGWKIKALPNRSGG